MTHEEAQELAVELDQAERNRQQIPLLSARFPAMTMDDAYAVQRAWVNKKLADGREIKGWKIGLTSKAMQCALGIDIPDSGVLFDDMFFDHGGLVPKGRFIQPRIEAEIAFIMKHDLSGEVSEDDVIQATEYVLPSLEILDTRILRVDPESGKTRTVCDTISDNAANAGLVLGNERHDPGNVDLRWAGAIVSRNGEVEETGLGAGVLNSPALSVAWLSRRLGEQGDHIRAGDVVLSGSFIRPIEAPSGSLIEADFGSFGSVSIRFE